MSNVIRIEILIINIGINKNKCESFFYIKKNLIFIVNVKFKDREKKINIMWC